MMTIPATVAATQTATVNPVRLDMTALPQAVAALGPRLIYPPTIAGPVLGGCAGRS